MTVSDLVCKFRPFAYAKHNSDGSVDIWAPFISPNGIVIDISREEVIGVSYSGDEHLAWMKAAKEVIPEETLAYHLLFWDES